MRRPTATPSLVAVMLAVAACSGSSDNADQFCDKVAGVQDELLAAQAPSSEDVTNALDDVDPPDEIADAYTNILDAYEDMGAGQDALTDPTNATRLADLNQDIAAVDDYITAECTPENASADD